MNWREILECTAVWLEEGPGWRQGKYCDDEGRCCVGGAMARVVGGSTSILADQEHNKAWRKLEACVGKEPVAWNDAPGRTQEEVVSTLRKVARQ